MNLKLLPNHAEYTEIVMTAHRLGIKYAGVERSKLLKLVNTKIAEQNGFDEVAIRFMNSNKDKESRKELFERVMFMEDALKEIRDLQGDLNNLEQAMNVAKKAKEIAKTIVGEK